MKESSRGTDVGHRANTRAMELSAGTRQDKRAMENSRKSCESSVRTSASWEDLCGRGRV